ncbi:ferredoxin [Vagococcus sp. DIV0080]|uniref:Ferredoxin n=1 Tax=Candidatus Vagococcus giribetii TaxID=2230876 RepID=A0ABS3HST7_9ENTE|nr:ferredoxin [Vagococcus sp. DIV0080]MBO0476817.1 ferredoxin [Vagococcus sp. DIV0080]
MLCKIIPKKCIACGLCQIKAPEIFDYYDDGIVKLVDSEEKEFLVSDDLPTDLLEAYRACPTRAIELKK